MCAIDTVGVLCMSVRIFVKGGGGGGANATIPELRGGKDYSIFFHL